MLPPAPDRYATDKAGVVDAQRLALLDQKLARFHRETSNQVVVFIDRRVPAGTKMEEFTLATANAWGVGQREKNNGIVFFVFTEERRMRIEVGYGLEAALPNARAARILDSYATPAFRAGDFAGGIEQVAAEIMKAARGEPFQEPSK